MDRQKSALFELHVIRQFIIDEKVQILRERPAMLRYKYTAYFVVSSFGQVLKRFLTTVFTDTILTHVEKKYMK